MKKVLFEQKKHEVWNTQQFVENKTEILRVLKTL